MRFSGDRNLFLFFFKYKDLKMGMLRIKIMSDKALSHFSTTIIHKIIYQTSPGKYLYTCVSERSESPSLTHTEKVKPHISQTSPAFLFVFSFFSGHPPGSSAQALKTSKQIFCVCVS